MEVFLLFVGILLIVLLYLLNVEQFTINITVPETENKPKITTSGGTTKFSIEPSAAGSRSSGPAPVKLDAHARALARMAAIKEAKEAPARAAAKAAAEKAAEAKAAKDAADAKAAKDASDAKAAEEARVADRDAAAARALSIQTAAALAELIAGIRADKQAAGQAAADAKAAKDAADAKAAAEAKAAADAKAAAEKAAADAKAAAEKAAAEKAAADAKAAAEKAAAEKAAAEKAAAEKAAAERKAAERKAAANARGSRGEPVLFEAIWDRDFTKMQQLLKDGANPNARTSSGFAIIEEVTTEMNVPVEIIGALCDAGGRINNRFTLITQPVDGFRTLQGWDYHFKSEHYYGMLNSPRCNG